MSSPKCSHDRTQRPLLRLLGITLDLREMCTFISQLIFTTGLLVSCCSGRSAFHFQHDLSPLQGTSLIHGGRLW